ncbi:DNA topoisomerase IV subunit B [uncultured Candidatus Kuenenia sp.]|jgi:topoisomerase-4 subunit B|uniref:DNA topoisomerase IV subunit B n=1 Tax=Candidatus Kuenenia sp. TaxID=2499824 RepID=UPI001D82A5FE|nr:DNA topoisomerase IV subunit B [uncultured Candidatus Kuenenia sp.]MBE7547219.1 type IIA DNA topoisomerase subunit B [Planctomycetia bacterium]MCL4727670.1 type IIA DNA topoisomerase subunit B [Candidatus Kuenenia stuttgartiensis]TVM02592.1 MAG: DNA topoisomerase IV [Candidatus Kuenenia stuttgartiensis]
MVKSAYTEEHIKSLDWKEHIRLRPGMYIGKLGDGSSMDDGIYVLVKEVVDNSIDEYVMGFGKTIEIKISEHEVAVRDYGRGIPLGKVFDCVAKINTGGKYDSEAFKKSVGLNGIGTKAVNALSGYFMVQSIRDGNAKSVEFSRGNMTKDFPVEKTSHRNGTLIQFIPDETIFKNYRFIPDFLENQIWNYAYLNAGLTIDFNGRKIHSENGLFDLLTRKTDPETLRYPIIHSRDRDIEFAFTHADQYGEEYYSFVNGQHTTQGGTHLAAFREAIVRTVREFYKKDFDAADIRASIVGAISVRIQEPVFESQTKTKLGSINISPDGISIRAFVNDYVKKELDDYLHKHNDVAEKLLKRILQSERERKEIAGIKKLANQRAKKANLHNKKLRDCRIHYNSEKNEQRYESSIFITEGDSASGSITKARNVETQAIFSLRGKPLNCFGLTKKVVYENEEFNLLQHALNIEDGIENLRYNNVIIATDADVDGMHIRLLLMTFFLQFFSDLVKNGHVYILETPLFRVRNKNETMYCYNEEEKLAAMNKMGKNPEITRFKGLGEISPNEFGQFIGENIRLQPLVLGQKDSIVQTLSYYMGKNTPDRQTFIIENLSVEKNVA